MSPKNNSSSRVTIQFGQNGANFHDTPLSTKSELGVVVVLSPARNSAKTGTYIEEQMEQHKVSAYLFIGLLGSWG